MAVSIKNDADFIQDKNHHNGKPRARNIQCIGEKGEGGRGREGDMQYKLTHAANALKWVVIDYP